MARAKRQAPPDMAAIAGKGLSAVMQGKAVMDAAFKGNPMEVMSKAQGFGKIFKG